ncbi:MAG TPA: hypothetical protein VFQ44_10710 [Streptosporangiaceae bacterium]|nr:hypothetical protein [Streptosporangiaceae bacterium]
MSTELASTQEGGWLAVAGQRAALAGVLRNAEYAREVIHRIITEKSAEYDSILGQGSSQDRVQRWRALIRAEDDLEVFRFFAFRPQDAVCLFGAEVPEVRRWSTLTEIYEACYALATQSASENGPTGMPYSWRLGAAHLARTRWMLLSQPFAARARPLRRDVLRVNDERGRVTALAQQARGDWLAVLAAIDDYPQLAARIRDLEADAMSVAMLPVTESVAGLAPANELTPADHDDPVGVEAARFAATRLLLPRFAWTSPARIYLRLAGRSSLALTAAAGLAGVSAIVQVLAGFWLAWPDGYTSAAITAAGVYPLVAAAMAAEPSAAWPWLLRQPASAAVGLLALAAFGTTWWFTAGATDDVARAVIVMAGLAAAALLYLYIEGIGHGVRGLALLRRPPWVTVIGLMHGLLVSLIGLRFLLPLFASSPAGGPPLSCWYSAASCHGKVLPVPLLLGLAATWSLAAGVFLQIIWDSEPVTATLAHVAWRRGG